MLPYSLGAKAYKETPYFMQLTVKIYSTIWRFPKLLDFSFQDGVVDKLWLMRKRIHWTRAFEEELSASHFLRRCNCKNKTGKIGERHAAILISPPKNRERSRTNNNPFLGDLQVQGSACHVRGLNFRPRPRL